MFVRSLVLLGWLFSATAAAQSAGAAAPREHAAPRAATPSQAPSPVYEEEDHGPVPNEAPGGPMPSAPATASPMPMAPTAPTTGTAGVPEAARLAQPVPNEATRAGDSTQPKPSTAANAAGEASAPSLDEAQPGRAPSFTSDRLFLPGVVVIGAGSAALLASLFTGLGAHGTYTKLERDCSANLCPSSAQNRIDSGKTLAAVSTVLTGVGIVAVGVGAALLIIAANRRTDNDSRSARLHLSAGPAPLGIGAAASF